MTKKHAGPIALGAINWVGFYSLYRKEVMRFLNVVIQSVAAPVVTSLLFLAIFSLALGRAVQEVNGVPFIQFLCPGLIIMTMAQNAFANTSSSMVIGKVQGNIIDVLMPPISAFEFILAYVLAGVTRGLMVGFATWGAMALFIDIPVSNIGVILLFGILASAMLAQLGLVAGIWSDKFDQMAAITNFIIVPLSFLSGTFYAIERLPEPFFTLAHLNPFFYMIDSFRSGFLGWSESPIFLAFTVLLLVNICLFTLAWVLMKTGYKLKS